MQCEEKCPSKQAMLVGKLWKSRKVMEKQESYGVGSLGKQHKVGSNKNQVESWK